MTSDNSTMEYSNDVDFTSIMDEYECTTVGNPIGDHWNLVDTEVISYLGNSTIADEKEYTKTDTPNAHRIHWKHSSTDTHMVITKQFEFDRLRYHARVTKSGTSITVGEFRWSESFDVVMNWAVKWMGRHYDDVSWLYE